MLLGGALLGLLLLCLLPGLLGTLLGLLLGALLRLLWFGLLSALLRLLLLGTLRLLLLLRLFSALLRLLWFGLRGARLWLLLLSTLRLLLLSGLLGALLWLRLLATLLLRPLSVLLLLLRFSFLLSAFFASLCVDGYRRSEKQEDRSGPDYFHSLHTYLLLPTRGSMGASTLVRRGHRRSVEHAQHESDEKNHQYCPQSDAGSATRTPAGMTVIASAKSEQQYQNDNQYQHFSLPFLSGAGLSQLRFFPR